MTYDVEKDLLVPTEMATMVDSVNLDDFLALPGIDFHDPGGFQVDILKRESIIHMILGQPFDIVSFTLPQLDLNLGADFGFDFKVLEFDIHAGVNLHIGRLGFVYDSTGLQEIADALMSHATPDWTDLLDGFYIANESGPELSLTMSVGGGGGVDVTVLTAEAHANLNGSLYFDLKDPNDDGKLRLAEVFAVTEGFSDPAKLLCLFDAGINISGGFDFSGSVAGISVSSDDLGVATHFSVDLSLSDVLGHFVDCEPNEGSLPLPPPILATEITENAQKYLRLNTGPFASARIYGDTNDEPDTGNAYNGINITVRRDSNGHIYVSGYGVIDQEYGGSYTKVVGFGGSSGDTFNLSQLGTQSAEMHGGGGNDAITTADGNDSVYGGDGNDSLVGGTENNTRLGEDGNDVLVGGSDNEVLSGGDGDDSTTSNGGFDQLDGGRGDDTLVVNRGTSGALHGGRGTDAFRFDESDQAIGIAISVTDARLTVGSLVTTYDTIESLNLLLGVRADTVTVISTAVPTSIDAGIQVSGTSDVLIVDRSGTTADQAGTVSGTQVSGFGLTGAVTYSGVEQLQLKLGGGNDSVQVDSTSTTTETTISGGAGNDAITVKSVAHKTLVSGDGGSDQVTADVSGGPSAFGDLRLNVETLLIDASAYPQSVSWKYDGTYVYTGTTQIIDATGAQVVNFKGGSGAADVLTVADPSSNPQVVTADNDTVTVQEGAVVLSGNGSPVTSVTTATRPASTAWTASPAWHTAPTACSSTSSRRTTTP